MEAAARSSKAVLRTKRPIRAAARVDIPAAPREAAAGAASHIRSGRQRKRARTTTTACRRCCPPDDNSNWRDWSDLGDGPAGLIAEPGDDHGMLIEYDGGDMTAAPIMFEGRFYCVNHSGVMRLKTGPPRFEVAAKLHMRTSAMADDFYLVNNCGELMLAHSRLRHWNLPSRFYDTYRVDLDTGTLIQVKSLGGTGRALFLGHRCSLSVSLEVFPSASISADTIYLSFDMYERVLLHVEAYHLADESVEPPNSFVQKPHTLADCLSLANTTR